MEGVAPAAELFKAFSNESRLKLLCLLAEDPLTVGTLAELAGLSQPLVSQHLRNLRQAGLVCASRSGKEVYYCLADSHVFSLIQAAIEHVLEKDSSHHTHDHEIGDPHV